MARIFSVVDVWDAQRSERSYRPAWPEETVREHIRSLSGTHFDPKVVEAFVGLLDKEEAPCSASETPQRRGGSDN